MILTQKLLIISLSIRDPYTEHEKLRNHTKEILNARIKVQLRDASYI